VVTIIIGQDFIKRYSKVAIFGKNIAEVGICRAIEDGATPAKNCKRSKGGVGLED